MRLGTRSRCVRCRMVTETCLCPHIVPTTTATRLVLVTHYEETYKPSNTGHLVKRVLPSAEVRLRGKLGQPFDGSGLEDAHVLFPAEDARTLSTAAPPDTLIVLDGTWRQARRIHNREPALAGLARVTLPPGPPSEFHLRRQNDATGSTLESVARALALLGEQAAADALMDVFRLMVERTLRVRGVRAPADRSASR